MTLNAKAVPIQEEWERVHRTVKGLYAIYGDDFDYLVSWPCSCYSGLAGTVYNAIHHLNDRHLWARERIADWVESLS